MYKNRKLIFFLILAVAISGVLYGYFFPLQSFRFMDKVGFSEVVLAKIFQQSPPVLYRLGNKNFNDERYDLAKAYEYYSKAADLDVRLPYIHYQMARIHFLNSRYAKAIKEVNLEIEYNPDFPRSYYLRGLIYGYDRQFEKAAEDFTEFIKRKPEEWAGYVDLSWVLFQQGEYQKIKKTLEVILASSRNAWILNAYGVALLNLSEFEEALAALSEAKELASAMSPTDWGTAYIGNNPNIYGRGLEEMKKNIDENITKVNNRLLK